MRQYTGLASCVQTMKFTVRKDNFSTSVTSQSCASLCEVNTEEMLHNKTTTMNARLKQSLRHRTATLLMHIHRHSAIYHTVTSVGLDNGSLCSTWSNSLRTALATCSSNLLQIMTRRQREISGAGAEHAAFVDLQMPREVTGNESHATANLS